MSPFDSFISEQNGRRQSKEKRPKDSVGWEGGGKGKRGEGCDYLHPAFVRP